MKHKHYRPFEASDSFPADADFVAASLDLRLCFLFGLVASIACLIQLIFAKSIMGLLLSGFSHFQIKGLSHDSLRTSGLQIKDGANFGTSRKKCEWKLVQKTVFIVLFRNL